MASRWKILSVFCLALCATDSYAGITCPDGQEIMYEVVQDRKMDNPPNEAAVTFPDVTTLEACLENCKDYEIFQCTAFNYNSVSKECELLSADDGTMVAGVGWTFYDLDCGSPEPSVEPTSSEPEPVPEMEEVFRWLQSHPEYAAMIGMGLMIILLFITAITILCCYAAGGSRADKYREKN